MADAKFVAGFDLSTLREEPLPGLAEFSRKVAAEGAVLLENRGEVLPLAGKRISVFGRMQRHYYKSGTGSGGLVNVRYVTNILDGLRANPKVVINEELATVYAQWEETHPVQTGAGWANEPWSQAEMPLEDAVAANAAAVSDAAVIVIGRTAGEDQDNSAKEGSFLLTQTEYAMIATVRRHFAKVCVVLNVGNIIDMSWVRSLDIPAVLYVWQGGMEGGNAAADLLCGDVTPSGKLSDTIACTIADYPSSANFGREDANCYQEDIYVGYRYFETVAPHRVLYPFGYGLSYTRFELRTNRVEVKNGVFTVVTAVRNIGRYPGRETVQVYVAAPQGYLGKPLRSLVGFAKTRLLQPGESETVAVSFTLASMASYDDSGVTGFKSCYLLEPGDYYFFAGADVRTAPHIYTYRISQPIVTERLSEALAPVREFTRMHPVPLPNGGFQMRFEPVPRRTVDLNARIAANRPAAIAQTEDRGIRLADVGDGSVSMEEFIAQLTDEELCCIVRGEGMCSPKVTAGTASAFGGVSDALLAHGIPVACASDGPSGIRMDSGAKATSLPGGTLLACTWNPGLIEQLYTLEGVELFAYHIDTLLGPGINIHRNPLCGRNFEYFSEDPLLTGIMATAMIRGISKTGVTATIKHFFANSQELCRHTCDSVISERAIREIYIKAFELAVKNGPARSIMTSYNPVNGLWTLGSYDLCTTILRGEWGYRGIVMSDWWAEANEEGEAGTRDNLRAMVRAQNDLYMVTTDTSSNQDNLAASLADGSLTRGELQRSAMNICRFLLEAPVFARFLRTGNLIEPQIDPEKAALFLDFHDVIAEHTYEFDVSEPGKYLLVLHMRSQASAQAQMKISTVLDTAGTGTFMLNGTGGELVSQHRDVYLDEGHHKLTFYFVPEELEIPYAELKR